MTPQTMAVNLPCFKDLIAVLFECFLIISLGYLSCRFKLISTQAKDLNSYLTAFALPMIIFLNIAQMEFKTINLSFLLCMLSAKLLVFTVVSSLTLTISFPRNFGYAGSLSILSTQSNDFALGYPLIKSLYGDNRPEMLNYLSLMAPIQLLILNPLGIIMLEYEKSKQTKKMIKSQQRNKCNSCSSPAQGDSRMMQSIECQYCGGYMAAKPRRPPLDLGFLKALAMNPLIIASVVALIVNLTYGPELPKFVTRVSNTIAASFAAPALFVVGTSMYGKFELLLKNPNDLLLSSVLVLAKVLILPNLMRTLTLLIVPSHTPAEEVPYLIDFSFLYGLLPTAPTACIIAKQYGILPDVTSISMLLSTFVSAPLMLAASAIINPSTVIKPADIEKLISQTVKISSVITFSLAFLTSYAIWKTKDRLNYTNFVSIPEATMRRISRLRSDPTKIFLLLLAVSQAMIGLGGIIWCFVDSGNLEMPHSSSLLHLVENEGEPLTLISTTSSPSDSLNAISESRSVPLRVPVAFPASLLSSEAQVEPLPLNEPLETLYQPLHLDFGLKTIFAAQYVFSSTGLMMSRFVILCIILVVAAKQFKGQLIASKVSILLTKIYVVLFSTIILWLMLDSDHSKRIAIEPSLPSENGALYVRLVFNIVFLCLSMPMFALIIREDNKSKRPGHDDKSDPNKPTIQSTKESNSLGYTSNKQTPPMEKNRLVTSSLSLASDSSSSRTNTTNLEPALDSTTPTPSLFIPTSSRLDPNNNPVIVNGQCANQQPVDSLEIIVDCRFSTDKSIPDKSEHRCSSDVAAGMTCSSKHGLVEGAECKQHKSYSNNNHPRVHNQKQPTNHDTSCRHCDIDDTATNDTVYSLNGDNQTRTSEFNKYSILIVFMLIDSMLSLTSITQKLIQDQPSGTFRQIEVISVALEFGQGLLTFLIYGMGRLLK